MKYLKLFESRSYRFLYTSYDINELISYEWSDIRIDKDTITFTADNTEYSVIYEKTGDIEHIYIQEEIRETFCKKINISLHNDTVLNNIKNINCLKNIKQLKKSKKFNL